MANQCSVCLGTVFSQDEGLIVCLTCGTQSQVSERKRPRKRCHRNKNGSKVASDFSLILFSFVFTPPPLPQNHQAFVEEAADYDAALADGARARVRVRGPTAAALRAAAAAKAAAAAAAAGTAAATRGGAAVEAGARREPPEQLRGAHVVAASLLALQRSLAAIMDVLVSELGVDPGARAEAKRLWGLAVAAARVFGDGGDGAGGSAGGGEGNGRSASTVASTAEARAEAWRDAEGRGRGGKSGPEAAASLAFSAGQELGRRGLGPRCLLSLALLAAWRGAAAASGPRGRGPPVTPLDLVRGAACGSIPFLDLSPFAAAAVAAAAAAAAAGAGAAAAHGDGNSPPPPLSLPPRLASLPLVSPRLLRPRSLPGADRVAARAARLGRALLANDDYGALPPAVLLPSRPPPVLPPLPNPEALAARWLSEMGAPSQLAAVVAELYRLLAPSALSAVAAASSRKKTPGSKKKKARKKRKKRTDESSSSESGSESERSSTSSEGEADDGDSDHDEDEGGGAKPRRRRRQQQQQRPPSTSPPVAGPSLPALTDDLRLDPVRALAASLVLSLKLCYGLGGPADRIDMRGFGQSLPGLPAAPRAERGDDGSGSGSDGDDGDGDGESAAVARGWRAWASAVVEASGRPPVPVCVPELGEDSDRYVRDVSRGVFCCGGIGGGGGGGGGSGGGGELEAALLSRARAAAEAATAAAEAQRRRAREEQPPASSSAPPPPPPAPPPRRRRGKSDKNTGEFWKPGSPWLCARWQPAGVVEAAAAASPAAAAATFLVPRSSSPSSSRPSDFALPPAYAAVLAAVSAHCGYVPRALHETAVALEDELSREKKRSVN